MSALNGGVPPIKYSDTGSHASVLARTTSLGNSRGSTPSPTTMGKKIHTVCILARIVFKKPRVLH